MDRELALKLVQDEKLMAKVVSFNLSLSAADEKSAAGEAWLSTLPEAQQQLYHELQSAYPKLCLFKKPPFAQTAEPADGWSYFADELERLALLDDTAFGEVCLWVGASRLAPFLRGILEREKQEQARELLGGRVLAFALQFGAFVLPSGLQRGSLHSESGELSDLRQEALSLGSSLLQSLSGSIADQKVKRVLAERLKALGAEDKAPALPEALHGRLRSFVLTVVLEVLLNE